MMLGRCAVAFLAIIASVAHVAEAGKRTGEAATCLKDMAVASMKEKALETAENYAKNKVMEKLGLPTLDPDELMEIIQEKIEEKAEELGEKLYNSTEAYYDNFTKTLLSQVQGAYQEAQDLEPLTHTWACNFDETIQLHSTLSTVADFASSLSATFTKIVALNRKFQCVANMAYDVMDSVTAFIDNIEAINDDMQDIGNLLKVIPKYGKSIQKGFEGVDKIVTTFTEQTNKILNMAAKFVGVLQEVLDMVSGVESIVAALDSIASVMKETTTVLNMFMLCSDSMGCEHGMLEKFSGFVNKIPTGFIAETQTFLEPVQTTLDTVLDFISNIIGKTSVPDEGCDPPDPLPEGVSDSGSAMDTEDALNPLKSAKPGKLGNAPSIGKPDTSGFYDVNTCDAITTVVDNTVEAYEAAEEEDPDANDFGEVSEMVVYVVDKMNEPLADLRGMIENVKENVNIDTCCADKWLTDAISVVNSVINLASCPVDGLLDGVFEAIKQKVEEVVAKVGSKLLSTEKIQRLMSMEFTLKQYALALPKPEPPNFDTAKPERDERIRTWNTRFPPAHSEWGEMEPWLAAADTSAQAGSYWCDTDLEATACAARFQFALPAFADGPRTKASAGGAAPCTENSLLPVSVIDCTESGASASGGLSSEDWEDRPCGLGTQYKQLIEDGSFEAGAGSFEACVWAAASMKLAPDHTSEGEFNINAQWPPSHAGVRETPASLAPFRPMGCYYETSSKYGGVWYNDGVGRRDDLEDLQEQLAVDIAEDTLMDGWVRFENQDVACKFGVEEFDSKVAAQAHCDGLDLCDFIWTDRGAYTRLPENRTWYACKNWWRSSTAEDTTVPLKACECSRTADVCSDDLADCAVPVGEEKVCHDNLTAIATGTFKDASDSDVQLYSCCDFSETCQGTSGLFSTTRGTDVTLLGAHGDTGGFHYLIGGQIDGTDVLQDDNTTMVDVSQQILYGWCETHGSESESPPLTCAQGTREEPSADGPSAVQELEAGGEALMEVDNLVIGQTYSVTFVAGTNIAISGFVGTMEVRIDNPDYEPPAPAPPIEMASFHQTVSFPGDACCEGDADTTPHAHRVQFETMFSKQVIARISSAPNISAIVEVITADEDAATTIQYRIDVERSLLAAVQGDFESSLNAGSDALDVDGFASTSVTDVQVEEWEIDPDEDVEIDPLASLDIVKAEFQPATVFGDRVPWSQAEGIDCSDGWVTDSDEFSTALEAMAECEGTSECSAVASSGGQWKLCTCSSSSEDGCSESSSSDEVMLVNPIRHAPVDFKYSPRLTRTGGATAQENMETYTATFVAKATTHTLYFRNTDAPQVELEHCSCSNTADVCTDAKNDCIAHADWERPDYQECAGTLAVRVTDDYISNEYVTTPAGESVNCADHDGLEEISGSADCQAAANALFCQDFRKPDAWVSHGIQCSNVDGSLPTSVSAPERRADQQQDVRFTEWAYDLSRDKYGNDGTPDGYVSATYSGASYESWGGKANPGCTVLLPPTEQACAYGDETSDDSCKSYSDSSGVQYVGCYTDWDSDRWGVYVSNPAGMGQDVLWADAGYYLGAREAAVRACDGACALETHFGMQNDNECWCGYLDNPAHPQYGLNDAEEIDCMGCGTSLVHKVGGVPCTYQNAVYQKHASNMRVNWNGGDSGDYHQTAKNQLKGKAGGWSAEWSHQSICKRTKSLPAKYECCDHSVECGGPPCPESYPYVYDYGRRCSAREDSEDRGPNIECSDPPCRAYAGSSTVFVSAVAVTGGPLASQTGVLIFLKPDEPYKYTPGSYQPPKSDPTGEKAVVRPICLVNPLLEKDDYTAGDWPHIVVDPVELLANTQLVCNFIETVADGELDVADMITVESEKTISFDSLLTAAELGEFSFTTEEQSSSFLGTLTNAVADACTEAFGDVKDAMNGATEPCCDAPDGYGLGIIANEREANWKCKSKASYKCGAVYFCGYREGTGAFTKVSVPDENGNGWAHYCNRGLSKNVERKNGGQIMPLFAWGNPGKWQHAVCKSGRHYRNCWSVWWGWKCDKYRNCWTNWRGKRRCGWWKRRNCRNHYKNVCGMRAWCS